MNVSLTKELDKWVNDKVSTGLYNSSSEVVREGLRLLMQKEEQKKEFLKDLRSELLIGIKQLDSNISKELNKDLILQIKKNAKKKAGK